MTIIERDSYQPLLKRNSPPQSPGRRKSKQRDELASYGTLAGEALLGHAAHESNSVSSTPQSVEPGQYAEYQQPLNTIPVQHATNNGISPGGLPPAIPLRRRADSSGDRSIGELSTVSGRSGHNRVRRSSSDGYEVLNGNGGNSLSPTYGSGVPPKPRRRSQSPKPPRSRSPTSTPGGPPYIPNGGSMNNGQYSAHPLHQRRSSDESTNRHRRTHSYDVPREQLRRGNSSASLYSLNSNNSQGSMNSETLKLLPDPRWGGGSGGDHRGDRARSYSSGSHNMSNLITSYSSDSGDPFAVRGVGYGSVGSGSKEVITNGYMNGTSEAPRHRRTNSEISTSTFASNVSIDKSVEPAKMDMTKSSMFKGMTDKGVVKLQLPKDNFRLLSDRDLESGQVYKRALVDNEDVYFQDYHITVDDTNESVFPTSECACPCVSCENCNGRRKQLPPTYYVMAVDSDIYRRMFDEVSESMSMPCGLYYCGHHEDVDYPSIGIAMTGVVIIFVVMLWATIYVDG